MAACADLGSVLTEVRGFLLDLAGSSKPSKEPPSPDSMGTMFSHGDEGLWLDREEERRYRRHLSQLWRCAGGEKEVSARTVERWLQKAMLHAIDMHGRRGESLEQRVTQALHDLKRAVTAQPTDHTVFIPVGGLAKDGLSTRFGPVEFCVFADEHRARLAPDTAIPGPEARKREEFTRSFLRPLMGQTVGVITVRARDCETAVAMARREVERVIDILNFFVGQVSMHGWLYLTGAQPPSHMVAACRVLGEQPSTSVLSENIGPHGEVSLAHLCEEAMGRNLGLDRAEQLVAESPSFLQSLLLAGMQWAGRAMTERRRDLAFLWFAIALETVVCGDLSPGELRYRLSIRTAHLVEDLPDRRRKVAKRVAELYKLRSDIVHKGNAEVTDADLFDIKRLAQRSIVSLLRDPVLERIRTPEQYAEWHEGHIYGRRPPGGLGR